MSRLSRLAAIKSMSISLKQLVLIDIQEARLKQDVTVEDLHSLLKHLELVEILNMFQAILDYLLTVPPNKRDKYIKLLADLEKYVSEKYNSQIQS